MKTKVLLLFLLLLHFFLLTLFRFTAWPELFSFPYLLARGYSLYGDMVHVYPPLLTYILAFIYKIFGNDLKVLQVFSWTLILVNDLLIYLIVTKLTGKRTLGIGAILFYIPLEIALEGNMLWFDTFMVTPMLLSLYYILKKNNFATIFWWSGAILSKQTALLFAPLYIYYIFQEAKPQKKEFLKILAGFTPVIVFIFYLLISGSLVWFLNWNFIYPSLYWKDYPGYYQLAISRREVLIIIALIFPTLLGLKAFGKNIYLTAFMLFSFLAFFPRFSFFHLQLFIALVVIESAYVIAKYRYLIPVSIAAVGLIIYLRYPYLKWDWQETPRFFEETTLAVADEINGKVNGKSVYFLNLTSQYYVLTGSFPPKPWVDNYGWYWEVPGFQQKTIKSWNNNPPELVVWQKGGYEPAILTSWIRANYNSTEREGYAIWQKKEN